MDEPGEGISGPNGVADRHFSFQRITPRGDSKHKTHRKRSHGRRQLVGSGNLTEKCRNCVSKFRAGANGKGDHTPLLLEGPRRGCEGRRVNEIGCRVHHVNHSLEHTKVTRVSSVPGLRQQDALTSVTRVACGDDAAEPNGLPGAAVKATNVVARSTSGGYTRIMYNGPSKRFYGVLDGNQLLCGRRSVGTLYNESVGQLTSEKSATLGEGDWGKGVGVEEEDWVRTESITRRVVGLRMGEGDVKGSEVYIPLEPMVNWTSTGQSRNLCLACALDQTWGVWLASRSWFPEIPATRVNPNRMWDDKSWASSEKTVKIAPGLRERKG
jgi:hypothetical protein